DEVPVIAILGALADGETVVRDAAELRVKESDRVATTVAGLRTLGVDAEELPDGLVIRGRGYLEGGRVESHGDHRIALAFAVAGSVARANVKVVGWSAVETSFPEFLDVLARARRRR
ncbi:MAG TPA: 3-phosphoshikimate 1-carboxyvinyltransferase, partial [Actinomycetota bacterium]|nr:3-phosphoshikimate 1-carboxyvinyltransferase [Actinomycetota bacterium]